MTPLKTKMMERCQTMKYCQIILWSRPQTGWCRRCVNDCPETESCKPPGNANDIRVKVVVGTGGGLESGHGAVLRVHHVLVAEGLSKAAQWPRRLLFEGHKTAYMGEDP